MHIEFAVLKKIIDEYENIHFNEDRRRVWHSEASKKIFLLEKIPM